MNVAIVGKRKISYTDKMGVVKTSTQEVVFDAIQTPTHITYEILASTDPVSVYSDFVMSINEVIEYPADEFSEAETVDVGREHLADLKNWIETSEEEGFTISFELG